MLMEVIKSIEYNYPVKCPLLSDHLIEIGTCFDSHMVVEGNTPKWTAPEEIFEHENYVEICEKCKHHRED